jgi:4-hydroxythreonine-4-phosphate dehydrogenase
MKQNPIWITEGDVTGISIEILEKAKNQVLSHSLKRPIILVQTQSMITPSFGLNIPLTDIPDLKKGFYVYQHNVLTKPQAKKLKFGKPSEFSGECAYLSLVSAAMLQKDLGGDILTLPLSKEWVIRSGAKRFIGHTEELQRIYGTKTFMLMYSKDLKVIPLTTHVPLQTVPQLIKKVDYASLFLAIQNSKLLKNPKIGVCGFNPHAGEGGKVGKEEQDFIIPLIKKFRKQGVNLSDPIPADSMFTTEARKQFDIILSWYHDQGLIPFKSLIGKKGVNVTLGLPFLRVSPDHGTAFDIAGKGLASPDSLIECLKILT